MDFFKTLAFIYQSKEYLGFNLETGKYKSNVITKSGKLKLRKKNFGR